MNKPFFKPRIEWIAQDGNFLGKGSLKIKEDIRVRVTDARELTAEQAIAKCVWRAWFYSEMTIKQACEKVCPDGYYATVRNGKVTVRKIRRAKQ